MEENEERMALEKCSTCLFYEPEIYEMGHEKLVKNYGSCKRYPPKVSPSDESRVPLVDDDWWCGEYKINMAMISSN